METEILEELARERDPSEELIYSMIGSRKLQILRVPVSGEGTAWELAHGSEGWLVSTSHAKDTDARPVLTGYQPLRCPGEAIGAVYEKISTVTLPFFLPPPTQSGQGGTFYEVAIWGGLYQNIRIAWWNDNPEAGWQEFTDYIQDCIAFFEGLQPDEKRACWWEK